MNDSKLAFDVLDRGYLRYVEHWGKGDAGVDEAAIIEAARMSTNKGFNGWPEDERLLAHLYKNRHSSPFEFAGMTIEVEAPLMVFREWHRHRTQSYGEMSARYIPLPNYNYMPAAFNILERANLQTTNKQAQSTSDFKPTLESLVADLEVLEAVYAHAQEVYEYLLKRGWPKELARLPVPVARYSRMRASGNLRNWLAFLTLRLDPNAQWEIRQYAQAVGRIIEVQFPRTWALFHGS